MKGLFIYRWRHPKNLGVNWIKNKSLEYDEDFKKECGDQEDLSPGGGVLQSVHNCDPVQHSGSSQESCYSSQQQQQKLQS